MKEKNPVRRSVIVKERWRFLAGNIAKRGVINVISRKAISPLFGTVALHSLFYSALAATKVAGRQCILFLHGYSEKHNDFMLKEPDSPGDMPFPATGYVLYPGDCILRGDLSVRIRF